MSTIDGFRERPDEMPIGFVGLGVMGQPLALNATQGRASLPKPVGSSQ